MYSPCIMQNRIKADLFDKISLKPFSAGEARIGACERWAGGPVPRPTAVDGRLPDGPAGGAGLYSHQQRRGCCNTGKGWSTPSTLTSAEVIVMK